MTVFNNYLKIAKKYIPMVITYTVIFVFFAVFSTTSNKGTNFTVTKPNIAVINYDTKTVFVETFTKYLTDNSKIIELDNNEESLKDALFFNQVDYILIIPANFTKNFMNSEDVFIETLKIPNSYAATYMEILLNKFLNISDVYVKSGMSEDNLSKNVIIDLEKEANVILDSKSNASTLESAAYFYNFTNYVFLALSILIIGLIMRSFNDNNLKRRNIISPISTKNFNFQLFLGNVVVIIGIWLLNIIISFGLYGSTMLTTNGLLLILNSLIFVFTALSIGFLVGSFVKNKDANSAISNVISLGTSFICGAFVPQQFLSEFVINISKIFPSYWFIKNNNEIVQITNFDFNNMISIFSNMFIVLLFGICYFVITNIILKRRKKSSN